MDKATGMAAAARRGETDSPAFMDAIRHGIKVLASTGERFQSYAVICYVRENFDVPMHDEMRAIGSLFTKAHRDGIIRPVGHGPSLNPSCNHQPSTWWVGTGRVTDVGHCPVTFQASLPLS
jgi:hypothetical protein